MAWDDFDAISKSPEDYVDWYKRGANYEEFDYPELALILRELKSGASVTHPLLHTLLHATDSIIFDALLGYLHPQPSGFIDFVVCLDCPLDISLARRLIRDFKDNDKTKNELMEEFEFYFAHSRPLFLDERFKEKADFVVDGCLKIEEQVEKVLAHLKNYF